MFEDAKSHTPLSRATIGYYSVVVKHRGKDRVPLAHLNKGIEQVRCVSLKFIFLGWHE